MVLVPVIDLSFDTVIVVQGNVHIVLQVFMPIVYPSVHKGDVHTLALCTSFPGRFRVYVDEFAALEMPLTCIKRVID